MTAGMPGQGADVDKGDTEAQATVILEKIKTALAEAGFSMSDVVRMHCWLAPDPKKDGKSDGAGWNAAYRKYFGTPEQPNKPARTTVTVYQLGAPTTLIEVEVIAAKAK
jgi:enamine deaminase RidA (YjgF/YER057c/UK114 family)